MNLVKAIQVEVSAKTRAEALAGAQFMAGQVGCQATRVLGDGIVKPWRAAGYFPAEEKQSPGEVLTEEMRVVLMPASWVWVFA